jgi:hypothetical protein
VAGEWDVDRHRPERRGKAQEGGYKLPWKVINSELGKARHTPEVHHTNAVLL